MKAISAIILVLFLWSCGSGNGGTVEPEGGHFYEEWFTDFPGDVWLEKDIIEFTPMIADNSKPFKLQMAIAHTTKFPISTLRMRVELVSPSGFKVNKQQEMPIKDMTGSYVIKCEGDEICQKVHLLEAPFGFYEPGRYTFRIHMKMDLEELHGIKGLALVLDEHGEEEEE